MPDYFSPGVYIEEFESGPRPISGVSTSIPGFLGLTAKGNTVGLPQLITSSAEFKRIYGSYLSKYKYNDFRFLPYAIDLFFANGGSACYVMRVEIPGAQFAECIINIDDLNPLPQSNNSDINNTDNHIMQKTQLSVDTVNHNIDIVNSNDNEDSANLTYTCETNNIYDVKIGAEIIPGTEFKRGSKIIINNKSVEDTLGRIFLVHKTYKEGTDHELKELKYFIITSAEKADDKVDITSSEEISEFCKRSNDYKYIFDEYKIKVYANSESINGTLSFVSSESGTLIYSLKKNINVKVKDYVVTLELEDSLLNVFEGMNKSKSSLTIPEGLMSIIFGEGVKDTDKKEIFEKGGGPAPTFDNPAVTGSGKIYYKSQPDMRVDGDVYISKIDSNIKGLKIKEVSDNTKLVLSYNGDKSIAEELKGSCLEFVGRGGICYYSFVKSACDSENSTCSVELLNTKKDCESIKFSRVNEFPIGISINDNTNKTKLKFLEMTRDNKFEITINEQDNIESINFDSDMVNNLCDMTASPIQTISNNTDISEKLKILEGGDTPDFESEKIPKQIGTIYYDSSKQIQGDVKIVQNKSNASNIFIDTKKTDKDKLVLSYNGDIKKGSILKFIGNNNNNYYSIIDSINKESNEDNKYSIKLKKTVFEPQQLRFCTIEEVPIGVKIGSNEEITNLDFSKITGDESSDTNVTWNINGVLISIDNIKSRNLFNMEASPLHIIAGEEKEEVIIHKLSGSVKMTFKAVDVGVWGNKISINISNSEVVRTKFQKQSAKQSNCFYVNSTNGFNVGDIVGYCKKNNSNIEKFDIIKQITDNFIELTNLHNDFPFPEEGDVLVNCKLTITVNYEEITEVFEGLVFNEESPDFIEERIKKSNLINVEIERKTLKEYLEKLDKHPFEAISGFSFVIGKTFNVYLQSGNDGNMPNSDNEMIKCFTGEDENADIPGKRKGLNAFLDNDIVSMICIPGVTNKLIQDSVINHCEKLKNRIAVLDIPFDREKTAEVCACKENIQTDYAAVYHPWLEIYDSLEKKKTFVPPSGAVVGIYARSDNQYGVHKAPANEIVKSITGLSCYYNVQEQDILNPKGINLIRSFSGQGIKVWGARTCSSNTLWKYINVRRLFIYLEETIRTNTNWIVFEPNNELLWLRVKRTIEVFLDTVWRTGALLGTSAEEAYYVDIGRSTMSQDDIDNGRLICIIGVAPVKPAEFVIFRFTQKTQEN